MVRELLLKQPSIEMEKEFARYRRMSFVYVSVFHLLEAFHKNIVHQERQSCSVTCLTKLVVFL